MDDNLIIYIDIYVYRKFSRVCLLAINYYTIIVLKCRCGIRNQLSTYQEILQHTFELQTGYPALLSSSRLCSFQQRAYSTSPHYMTISVECFVSHENYRVAHLYRVTKSSGHSSGKSRLPTARSRQVAQSRQQMFL